MTTTPAPAAPRYKPGRGSAVPDVERYEIQRMFLVEGLSKAEIARRTGRRRETVASVLTGPDYERFREAVETDLVADARRTLKNNVRRAADGWVKAIDAAAEKGDHKPSKDLLMHTGVIEPLGERGAQGALLLVGVNVYQDCQTGQEFRGAPPSNRTVVTVMTPQLAQAYRDAGLPAPFEPPTQDEIEAALAAEARPASPPDTPAA